MQVSIAQGSHIILKKPCAPEYFVCVVVSELNVIWTDHFKQDFDSLEQSLPDRYLHRCAGRHFLKASREESELVDVCPRR